MHLFPGTYNFDILYGESEYGYTEIALFTVCRVHFRFIPTQYICNDIQELSRRFKKETFTVLYNTNSIVRFLKNVLHNFQLKYTYIVDIASLIENVAQSFENMIMA